MHRNVGLCLGIPLVALQHRSYLSCDLRYGRRRQQRLNRHSHTEHGLDASDELHRAQRMAAEVEKIVMH
ncbi:MAG TPA: hypothetical protein VMV45_05950, partial [Casimicrobiaceae bacterium]|nr:hypothetical protein [Casimicrobiaceae bacterium]